MEIVGQSWELHTFVCLFVLFSESQNNIFDAPLGLTNANNNESFGKH